jgi:nitric oxide dioxygenase
MVCIHPGGVVSITEHQKRLVQDSFKQVVPIAETAAELFYGRLFELDPSLQSLFRHDMKEQGRILMQTLSVVVNGLNRLDTIAPAIENLGKRHVQYGVQPQHYETVGAALLWTLAQGLGADFTPDVEAAWTAAYMLVAETAITASYPAAELESQPN